MKLHKMTWGDLQKHHNVDSRYDASKVIPEAYWFETDDGRWYMVDKGAIGWNIYDDKYRNEGFAETLREIRSWNTF